MDRFGDPRENIKRFFSLACFFSRRYDPHMKTATRPRRPKPKKTMTIRIDAELAKLIRREIRDARGGLIQPWVESVLRAGLDELEEEREEDPTYGRTN